MKSLGRVFGQNKQIEDVTLGSGHFTEQTISRLIVKVVGSVVGRWLFCFSPNAPISLQHCECNERILAGRTSSRIKECM